MEKNPVIFLPVPASLKDEIRHHSRRMFNPDYTEDEEPDESSPDETSLEESAPEISFDVDPSIFLPAELAPGESSLDPATLSWEMIISGMLRIISACGRSDTQDTSHKNPAGSRPGAAAVIKPGDIIAEPEKANIPPEWIDYYRRFVFIVKPEIYNEFSSAAIVKAGNGEFDMALEISDVLEGLFPRSPGVLLNKALILEDKAAALEKHGHSAEKENEAALEAYEAALSAEPVLPDTLFNAGFFFMRSLRDFARARDCFSRYAALGEDTDIPAEKKKQAQKIIKNIDEQGLDDSNYQDAYECISQGNDEEGLPKIREFIESHPKVWNGWFVLGWALRKLGRYKDSLEAFKETLELGGDSGDTRNEMAICLMEMGDLKAARKELEHALREEPENIKIISNLGVLAMKAGNRDEAAAFFRTVLELDPEDALATHFLEEI